MAGQAMLLEMQYDPDFIRHLFDYMIWADRLTLAAGQKILLRVGPDNRKRLKEKLRELKAQLLQVSVAAPVRP